MAVHTIHTHIAFINYNVKLNPNTQKTPFSKEVFNYTLLFMAAVYCCLWFYEAVSRTADKRKDMFRLISLFAIVLKLTKCIKTVNA
jgi:hypothetical protein